MTPRAVGSLRELEVGSVRRLDVDGVAVCLVRTSDAVHAVSDVCSHADVSLAEGELDGNTIECWLHGSRFDLVTGTPTGLPATAPVPVYPVTVDGDTVLVEVH
jgi:3-phenylpropionate/trans-cinnamate dioxygenase ferredoxin component